ncbi:DUF2147 domain-containing protein [bacterium]|nr:DUF2147 domain-containing protein [bacterium]
MKKVFLAVMGIVLGAAAHAAPLVGTYQTIDDETNTPKSIVQIYEYTDGDDTKVAGRIVALYGADGKISETLAAPVRVADRVPGAPTYVGLDIIWNMVWDADDNRYSGGKIMDPQSGKVYASVMWTDTPGQLNVRGKIGPFGRTQNWRVLDDASAMPKIDTKNWTPTIRK